jgi:hypothetical protein
LGRLSAAILSALLDSCGTSRHAAPARPEGEGLTHLVLFIRELADGTVTHSWKRAEDLDLSQYRPVSSERGAARRIVLAMGRTRDCDEENRACLRECMSRPLPRGFGHITSGGRGLGGKEEYCNKQCMQPYLDCVKLQELQPQEFTAADGAVDWLKRHRQSLLVGSVVIIAGVAFVVVSAGAGLVILAPAVLLATPEAAPQPFMAEVSQ